MMQDYPFNTQPPPSKGPAPSPSAKDVIGGVQVVLQFVAGIVLSFFLYEFFRPRLEGGFDFFSFDSYWPCCVIAIACYAIQWAVVLFFYLVFKSVRPPLPGKISTGVCLFIAPFGRAILEIAYNTA